VVVRTTFDSSGSAPGIVCDGVGDCDGLGVDDGLGVADGCDCDGVGDATSPELELPLQPATMSTATTPGNRAKVLEGRITFDDVTPS
jgi:hypothetical protein